jgi:hypothetical protein
MWDWIVKNKEWVFSGAGVAAFTSVWWVAKKLFSPEPRTALAAPMSNSMVQAPAINVAPVFNLPQVGASSQPVSQKPPEPAEPNLVFCQIGFPHLYRVGDEFVTHVSAGSENFFPRFRGIVAEIMNASKSEASVGPAKKIKAELAIQLDDREEILGPLAWSETTCNTVSIEMGNPAQIILAVVKKAGPREWKVPINRRPRTDVLPGDNKVDLRRLERRGEVNVQLRIIQPESGRTLRIFGGIYRWVKSDQDPEFIFGP